MKLSKAENIIVQKFQELKTTGWLETTRPNNRDGGAGNTLEDLLGIKENNLCMADFNGFEIKSQRGRTSSKISLFSKSPSFPENANSILKERYGEKRNKSKHNKLYASIFGDRESLVYEKYLFKLSVDNRSEKLRLIVKNADGSVFKDVYWTFEILQQVSMKINNLVLFSYEEKIEHGKRFFFFTSAIFYFDFQFSRFINMIKSGDIQFDIRIGEYNSGKNKGKAHDHGSGFRVHKSKIELLYDKCVVIE